jgi:CBS domain-containing protein
MKEMKRGNTMMRVQDVMTKQVHCCNAATNAAAAAEIMWNANVGMLPVVEDGGRAVGVVTDRDLFIALGTTNRQAAAVPVGEVMKTGLSLCHPEDDIRTALKTMAQQQLHRLPVVDVDGSVKGILSLNDVALRAGADGVSTDDVARTLKAICGQPQGVRALERQPSPSKSAAA